MDNIEPWTIKKILDWTTQFFTKNNIESPRPSAEILLAYSLNLQRIDLYLQYDKPMNAEELAFYKSLVLRRKAHEPIAYIVGKKEFWTLQLEVNPNVLIPRPDTECIVEAALRLIPNGSAPKPLKILDVGVGSGAIIIALAKERPHHFFMASDRSKQAIYIAKRNAKINQQADRIHFYVDDWLTSIQIPKNQSGDKFEDQSENCAEDRIDMIVSNPPYIKRNDIPKLQPDIYQYEPNTALDGGTDGLDAIRILLSSAPKFLKTSGHLLLEIGYNQKKYVKSIVSDNSLFSKIDFIKDYSGIDRVAICTK